MPAPKPSSFLPELKTFAANLKDVPYERLLDAAAEAGWETLVNEIDAVGCVDATTLVRFSVAVGREGRFEPFDTISVKTGPGPGPVSIAARLLLTQSLIYLFFGRLPQPAPAAVPERTVAMDDADVTLPGETPLPEDDTPEQEYVADKPSRRAPKMPSLIDHLEPDGVPVFIDLDDVPNEFTSEQIIAQFLADIDRAAVKFESREQLVALYTKNDLAMDFIKDPQVATDKDRNDLKDLLGRHEARIADNSTVRDVRIPGGKGSEAPAPRRRQRTA